MDIKKIVDTYKGSTEKLRTFDNIVFEYNIDPVELFKILIEHNCIDGRLFRQGRYKDEWFQAKRETKENNKKEAENSVITLNALKKENAKLRKENEKLKKKSQKDANNSQENEIPESYQKTIDAQQIEIKNLNETIENLIKASEEMNKEIASSERVNDSLAESNDALMAKIRFLEEQNDGALIEDLRTSISAKEDEIRELNSRIQSLKVQSFNESADEMVAQSKLRTLEDKNAKLLERIRGLEEENEELKCTNCADDIKRQLAETTQNYNEAMIINKKLEEQISFLEEEKESDGVIIVDQAKKTAALEKKLNKIEQYVLELMIYDQV